LHENPPFQPIAYAAVWSNEVSKWSMPPLWLFYRDQYSRGWWLTVKALLGSRHQASVTFQGRAAVEFRPSNSVATNSEIECYCICVHRWIRVSCVHHIASNNCIPTHCILSHMPRLEAQGQGQGKAKALCQDTSSLFMYVIYVFSYTDMMDIGSLALLLNSSSNTN
jgi:hypothetical protein